MFITTRLRLQLRTSLAVRGGVSDIAEPLYSSIERLPDKSSIFSADLYGIYLALDRVKTADDDERNFIIFSDSESALQAILSQDWTNPLALYILERLHWLEKYQEKRILFYWIPSHVGIIGNEKADTATKPGVLRRVTNVPIPYGDLRWWVPLQAS